jgi:hypothetical protein
MLPPTARRPAPREPFGPARADPEFGRSRTFSPLAAHYRVPVLVLVPSNRCHRQLCTVADGSAPANATRTAVVRTTSPFAADSSWNSTQPLPPFGCAKVI